jgi:hypothetical protein
MSIPISLKLPPERMTTNVANEAMGSPIRNKKRTVLPTLPPKPLPNAKITGVKNNARTARDDGM